MPQLLADKVATYPVAVPDQQIADALNVPAEATYGVKPVDAATSDARAILMTSGAWGKIGLIADGAYSPVPDPEQAMALRALCLTVRDAHNNLTLFKMTDPGTAAAVAGMVENLLAATLIDKATNDALLALGSVPASWADVNNGSQAVTARAVALARRAVA